ncbi:hypothetical protein COZ73_04720 [Candidatus Falkowbacteria bacterium CG_4_8_14_3_um_filter_36_11]|nr:MAG: hypothetical protein COZ73_04720 [Candidatus Falkowbacteria bacterium CG_4_8_14_3_um_filter_36_11]
MLNQYLIEKMARDQKIAPLNIIREYLEIETLSQLSKTGLSADVIFYGGTALRLAYGSFRYSEDLDFLLVRKRKSNINDLEKAMIAVALENQGVSVEEVIEKRQTIFGLLHIKNPILKHAIRIKIEISKKKNGIKSENVLLFSPASNKEVIFPVATMASLHWLKAKAMRAREMPRDWFDYWYLCQKLRMEKEKKIKFPFAKQEFSRELKRWLPQDKWKIITNVIKFYANGKN